MRRTNVGGGGKNGASSARSDALAGRTKILLSRLEETARTCISEERAEYRRVCSAAMRKLGTEVNPPKTCCGASSSGAYAYPIRRESLALVHCIV